MRKFFSNLYRGALEAVSCGAFIALAWITALLLTFGAAALIAGPTVALAVI